MRIARMRNMYVSNVYVLRACLAEMNAQNSAKNELPNGQRHVYWYSLSHCFENMWLKRPRCKWHAYLRPMIKLFGWNVLFECLDYNTVKEWSWFPTSSFSPPLFLFYWSAYMINLFQCFVIFLFECCIHTFIIAMALFCM